jgi:hypothetical protein
MLSISLWWHFLKCLSGVEVFRSSQRINITPHRRGCALTYSKLQELSFHSNIRKFQMLREYLILDSSLRIFHCVCLANVIEFDLETLHGWITCPRPFQNKMSSLFYFFLAQITRASIDLRSCYNLCRQSPQASLGESRTKRVEGWPPMAYSHTWFSQNLQYL